MLARFRSINIADRRDVLLFVVLSLVAFGATLAWALLLAGVAPALDNWIVLGLVIILSALAAVIPAISWARGTRLPRAQFLVRFGLGLQIFGLLITPIGLYYETNPVISVPIGFASFLTVFFGIFIAGFGGNMLAPKKA